MDAARARRLVQETFQQGFDRARFESFLRELLNRFESKPLRYQGAYIPDAFKDHVALLERIGTYAAPGGERVDLLVVQLAKHATLARARTALRNYVAHYLKKRDEKDAALVAFVSPSEPSWRFSYVRMEYTTVTDDDGRVGVQTQLTPARRLSYLVGEGESCHTAQSRFLEILQRTSHDPTIEELEAVFSVEAVTKEFFEQYKLLFLNLKEALDAIATRDKAVAKEFATHKVTTIDFAKKLMGQIVFLYFIQKKGWLGVAKGQAWGTGPRDFIRRLTRGDFGVRGNIFNDILEPLFYDTLATERGQEAWCSHFQCRIPFLNGGLFEPLGGYDWVATDIVLPDGVFTNSEKTTAGDVGTGILDVFDRYNFTVNEAEPLEIEVAIDPEMLGKVFENLLEVRERKSKGSFYTPREIVHYMCQESLIYYLDARLNRDGRLVERPEIEELIRAGEQAAHYEAARKDGTVSYVRRLPAAVERYARAIDEALSAITVCDPAIGSGAFPVGMMTEIVRARTTLTPYFEDSTGRTPYDFKRHAIQACLYGVDIDLGAVEIAKLRLWLSLVVDEEDVAGINPLPNLDFKIVVGNSLLGVEKTLFNSPLFEQLEKLKPKYFDESNRDKKAKYKSRIEALIHELTNGREVFDFEIYFSEVFHANSGFDVLMANPPYLFARDSAAKGMTPEAKRYYYKNYELAEYQVNLYPLFIEKADRLLASRGTLTFITPNNWLTINTNKALRGFVLARSSILIVNFYARVFESADVDSAILMYEKGQHNPHVRLLEYTDTFHELQSAPASFFTSQRDSIINVEMFKGEAGAIDLITRIEDRSSPLKLYGDVKVGLGAYGLGKGTPAQTKSMIERRIYHSTKKEGADWYKYLEGSDVCRYHLGWSGEYLKHGDHLREPRKNWALFSSPRLLVRQIPNKPPYCIHACYADKTILNDRNSMNVINVKVDPFAILAILNSRLISFWFALKFGKLQRGLFPQFKANELADFPIPRELVRFEKRLAVLSREATEVRRVEVTADIAELDRKIDALVYEAFGLTPDEIAVVEGTPAEVSDD